MAEVTSLSEGVKELVHDGDQVAIEGFTHLIPFAAGHEVLRQGRRDLELVRETPAVGYDQVVGAGAGVPRVGGAGGGGGGGGGVCFFSPGAPPGGPPPAPGCATRSSTDGPD